MLIGGGRERGEERRGGDTLKKYKFGYCSL